MTRKPALTCAFTNLKPGTGKSTCSTFLAAALHRLDDKVLQVDADPGASVLRWSDLAGGFPWSVIGLPKTTIGRDIVTVTNHGDWDSVIIDCPQMEDHERIVRPAMEYADVWIVPLAPVGIELDRTAKVVDRMDSIDLGRDIPGRRIALLNRTNRLQRSRTGPDAECAEILRERGFTVLEQQVNHNDTRYRQTFGTLPDPSDTPFMDIAQILIEETA